MEKTESSAVYSIGTVARLLGVSVQTLRLYEHEGLILPRKSASGQRRYSARDLERLQCIRKAITEEKIGIAGIRRMQALIPCWQIAHCTESDRAGCPAFTDHEAGCWTYRHRTNTCAERVCIECEVYHLSTSCAGIKGMIQHVTVPPTSLHGSTEHP